MKKLTLLFCVCLCLFASCGTVAEGDANPLPTMKPEDGANHAFILPKANQVSIQNTKRGCEILMITELGRQVFVLPYHYDLGAYEGVKVSTTEGRKEIEPFDVYGKKRDFFSEGKLSPHPDRGVAFEMPDGSILVIIAINGVNWRKLRYLRFTMDKGKLPIRFGSIDAVHFVEASSSYANQTIIPLYHLESDKCYSEPTDISQLLGNHSVNGLYVSFN